MIARRVGESALYSFTVCMYYTDGDLRASSKSAALAALATLVYAAVDKLFKQLYTAESFFLTCLITYLAGEKCCLNKVVLSMGFTLIPYALKNRVDEIPLFGIIVT
jgi:hypothetical protein